MKRSSLKELQLEWDKKLKDSGFNDIEDSKGRLKTWSTYFQQPNVTVEGVLANQEYYNLAGKFLHDFHFDKEIHKVIWEYHANGMSIRDIVRTLGRAKVINPSVGSLYSRKIIFEIIRDLSNRMRRMYLARNPSDEAT